MDAFRSANLHRDARASIDERDEAGERVIAARRVGVRAAMSAGELQRSVARDLEGLMNTVNFAAGTDLTAYPTVASSILNYGFVDISRRSIDESAVNDIAREIERVLITYEPRLVPETIVAKRDESVDPSELKLRFVVRADIDCDPLNLPVEFVADLDQDTGKIAVRYR